MTRRRTRLSALLPVLGLVLAACATGPGTAQDGSGGRTVRVAHVPSTLFAPLYIADAKGYFEQQGIDVQLKKVKAGQDAVPLAAYGNVEAVVAGFSAGLFNGVAQGLKVKVAASMGASTGEKPSPTALEVSRRLLDAGKVGDPSDLRGRKVAVAGGAGAAGGYQLDVMLRKSGLALKDVKVVNVPMPDMRAALADGGVAAALPPAPFTTAMERAGVAEPLAVPPEGTVATGLILGSEFAGKQAAKSFLTALRRGAADLQGDGSTSRENLRILAGATGQTLDVLRGTPPYQWHPRLEVDTAQLSRQQTAYREAGLLTGKPVAVADMVR